MPSFKSSLLRFAKPTQALALASTLLWLCACGQRGPLYMPDPDGKAKASANAAKSADKPASTNSNTSK